MLGKLEIHPERHETTIKRSVHFKEHKATRDISIQHHTSKKTKPQETLVIKHQQPDAKCLNSEPQLCAQVRGVDITRGA